MIRSLLHLCVLLSLMSVCVMQGCATGPQTSDRDLQFINKAHLQKLLENPTTKNGKKLKVVLVDVRPADAYAKKHIPGAINIPLGDMHAGDPRLTSANVIVVYAGGWQDPQSAAGAKELIALGYHNVREFRGGLASWEDQGASAGIPANPSAK